jgi:6-phosphofructokinase 2
MAMTDILTITLNPALDIATSCDALLPSHKLRCAQAEYFPGGGGINVARVIQRLGGDCLALYLAGGVVGQRLHELLAAEHVQSHRIAIVNETRESFSVRETSTGREYRFVLPGPSVTAQEWQACVDYLASIKAAPRYVVLSGSLPPGLPDDSYAQLTRQAAGGGSRVVLDSSGAALSAALRQGVFLVKPSLRELADWAGCALNGEAAWARTAMQLVRESCASLVALSLGEQGALLASADGVWHADALKVPVASSTGAGDSFLAAMVFALARGQEPVGALRHGVAAGSAALLHTGTRLCDPGDVQRLVAQVQVRALN